MSILNVMWAGGSAFASVHKVHQQILSQAAPGTVIKTWLLRGPATGCVAEVGECREWNLSSARLKGKHAWRLLSPWLRASFRKALQDSDAQVLLLDGLGVARTLLPVLKSLPHIRAVVVIHGSTRLHRQDRKLFLQLPASQLTLAAVSQTLAACLEDDLQMPVTTLRSAFDPQAFNARLLPRAEARAALGLPASDVPVFGAVGRLVDDKGFACLLEAFAKALASQPDMRLVIIGEGANRAALEARVDLLGLRDKVSLPGHLKHAATLYKAFDWVAIPSLDEGLGLILQEAVMSGVPVLTSDLQVFREQLADTGRYAPVNDIDAWQHAILQALDLPARDIAAEQYVALAPDLAWQRFSRAAASLLSC
ncbi:MULTISPECIES: glycosyltransferase [Pseudomonas]|uniref:Glycosyl transferase n=1 Tax=Pseudomonas chlororaphis TaxID=587753 RepID=A0A0D5Y6Q0_9PSED|nr:MULTISPECIES: glycosyltransferase [Pseudomonas]AJO76213.1 glycosyl transferase [Pseudomonas sp. MRSN 12121]AKA27013.1 glycosyl transferase [Pseudomonas chlororaphis]